MKRGTPDHPKMVDLAEAIHGFMQAASVPLTDDESLALACGLIERLWHFTARYAPAGDIGKYSDSRIAKACGWSKDDQWLIKVLTGPNSLFLDEANKVRLYVHDWHVHSDEAADKWLADHNLTYANGSPPRRKPKVATSPDLSRQSDPSSSSESSSESNPSPPREPGAIVDEFVEAWNQAPGTVRIIRMSQTRRLKLLARMREKNWDWRAALAKFPLRCFEGHPQGWRPDFDWIVRPDTVTKVIEGKYDWVRSSAQSGRTNGVPDL